MMQQPSVDNLAAFCDDQGTVNDYYDGKDGQLGTTCRTSHPPP